MESSKEKKINVAHVSYFESIGGVEMMLMDYLKYTKQNKFKIYLIAINSNKSFIKKIPKKISYISLFRKSKFDFKFLYKVYKFIIKNKIQIVHTHGAGPNAFVGIIVKLFTNTKLVVHEHGTGWYTKFLISNLESKIMQLSNRIIVNSNETSLIIQNTRNAPKKLINVIYNGISFDRLKPKVKLKRNKYKKFIIGMLGRLTNEKDIFAAIDAFDNLKEKNSSLIIVGAGKLKSELQKYTRFKNRYSDIHFIGSKINVGNYYRIFDIFIVTSIRESYANTVCEAGYCKVPVIASNIDGLNENVLNNKTGYLIKADILDIDYNKKIKAPKFQVQNNKLVTPRRINSNSLAKKIDKLLKNPQLRKKLGNKAHEIIKERNSLKKYVQSIEDIYNQLIDNENQK